MSNQKGYIGIFDSGIGGLTVARSVMESMPQENIVYFGDTAHLPYGTKSDKQIREYAVNDVTFLSRFDLKALVIACNTADSVARTTLEEKFDLPIYGVIRPASKKAVAATRNKKIGVMATAATVRSGAYTRTIHEYDPEAKVYPVACGLLVPLVENGRWDKDDIVVKTVLQEYLGQLTIHGVDTIILGCTHYPLLQEAIESLVNGVTVISSSEAAAQTLEEGLNRMDLLNSEGQGKHMFFVSDDAEHFNENAVIFLGRQVDGDVEQVKI